MLCFGNRQSGDVIQPTYGEFSMNNHDLSTFLHRLFIYAFCILATVVAEPPPSSAETNRSIQEMSGSLEGGGQIIYTLSDLKKGDTLFAYMTSTGGNLDPLLGIAKNLQKADIHPADILKAVSASPQDLVTAITQSADNRFLAWDDDSGSGFDASLQFRVPADGTYFIFAESALTNQNLDALEPGFTLGSFRLLLGLDTPEVAENIGESTGQPFATIDEKYIKRHDQVQQLDVMLSEDKRLTFRRLKKLQPGDLISARLESMNGSPVPQLYLTDFGSKPLMFGKADKVGDSVLLSYRSLTGGDGLMLYVDASNIVSLPNKTGFRLIVGINAPEVLEGKAVARGIPVFQQSRSVQIRLWVDQIANVDQQKENFSVVGSLELIWQDPAFAFSPDKCKCSVKKMRLNDLESFGAENEILLPNFFFSNQQGNRWKQGENVIIEPSGRTTYNERFTVTLQEPSFDFRAYPFDHQIFNISVDLVLATEAFLFENVDQPYNALGDQLGEEEWSVINYDQKIESVTMSKNFENSRFTMSMQVERHLNYYIVRILIPLCLIISISWFIFFLKDYGRQLEVASGNLLVFVAFNFAISNDLPRLGYLTLLDRVILTSFSSTAIVVLISVYQKRLEAKGKKELASKIDNVVLVSYPLVYVVLIAFEYLRVTSSLGS
jgi:hypothetical protein